MHHLCWASPGNKLLSKVYSVMYCTAWPYFWILKFVPYPFSFRLYIDHLIRLKTQPVAEVLESQVDPTITFCKRYLQAVPWISFYCDSMFLNLHPLFYVSSFVKRINLFSPLLSLLSLYRRHWNFQQRCSEDILQDSVIMNIWKVLEIFIVCKYCKCIGIKLSPPLLYETAHWSLWIFFFLPRLIQLLLSHLP